VESPTLIGLLSPNFRESRLGEVRAILPREFVVSGFGYPVPKYTETEFARAEQGFWAALDTVAKERPECLVITGELFLSRVTYGDDQPFLARVREQVKCPVITMTRAVADAFEALALRRIAVASPFPSEQTARHVDFLRAEGAEIVAQTSLGYRTSDEIWELPPHTGALALRAMPAAAQSADGFYLPCNLWRITARLEELERTYGKPIVANTPAWIRAVLREVDWTGSITGYGQLLSC